MKLFGSISNISSLVFQIILVLIAVLVFSFFDPFDLLAPTKKKLKDTPIQVESIREIGELITAEYYGEVLTSLSEIFLQESEASIDSFNYEIDELHSDFVASMDSLSEMDLKKNEVFGQFISDYDDITENPLYEQYIYYINEKIKDRKYKKRELTKTLSDSEEESIIRKLGWRKRDKYRNDLHAITTRDIQDVFKEVQEQKVSKDLKRSRLVLLGRGWVKAGFDFGSFTERNFIYDKAHKRVILIGLNPEILSATINPWFIPEEGVEGFEFVIVQRKVRHDPESTKRVKKRCLEKLVAQALNKHILAQAQTNAEEQLKDFFTLLLDDDEFQGVYFYTDYLEYSLRTLLEDDVIQNEEIITIDTILNYIMNTENASYAIENYKPFLDSLRKAEAKIYDIPITLNSKSSVLFNLTQELMIDIHVIDSTEAINRLSDTQAIDSIWFNALKENKTKEELLIQYEEQFFQDLENLKSQLKHANIKNGS